jgi:hypothetical protein
MLKSEQDGDLNSSAQIGQQRYLSSPTDLQLLELEREEVPMLADE